MNSGLMDMAFGFTVLRITSMIGMLNISFTKEELLKMNAQLNKIKKPQQSQKVHDGIPASGCRHDLFIRKFPDLCPDSSQICFSN